MRNVLIYVTAMILTGTAMADTRDMKKDMQKPTMTKTVGLVVLTPIADVKFVPVPDMKGVSMAAVEGDPKTGPSHFMVRFDKNFAAPVHHHTADHFATVLSGTIVLTVDGKDVRMGPGSFFSFTGQKPHATKCVGATACTVSVDARGAWDVIPEATAMGEPNSSTTPKATPVNPSAGARP